MPGTTRPSLIRCRSPGYPGATVPFTLTLPVTRDLVMRDGKMIEIVRDKTAEAHALERLQLLGFGRLDHHCGFVASHRHAKDLVLLDPDQEA